MSQSSTLQSASLNLELHPKQLEALNSQASELLYGGAAGGGKSHLMRVASVLWCSEIPGLQVYLFRRVREDLVKNHMEGPSGFRALLSGWEACGFVKIVEDEIRFWNGSKIYLCHCKDAKDVYKYQGAEIHVLLIDELTHFTDSMYRFLRNRVRMVGVVVPEKYRGKFPRILCGANPGNIGHQFVKSTFIDGAQPMELRAMNDNEGGMLRQYIPARLTDNPSMTRDDPGYEARLSGLGSSALVKAMKDGDWNVVEGAFFEEWNTQKHVLRPVPLPTFWSRFRSMDWGSASPFSVGWNTVAMDDWQHPDGPIIPRGAIIRYREWYGAAQDSDGKTIPNKGLKLTAEQVARGIRDREIGDLITDGVLDPSAFAEDGGPSIATRMANEKVYFNPADNTRIPLKGAMGGWDQVRARLVGDGVRPALYVFSTCTDLIRTLPVIQHSKIRPEDLDTNAEDHALDELRYACMSRPYSPPFKEADAPDRYARSRRSESSSSGQGWQSA